MRKIFFTAALLAAPLAATAQQTMPAKPVTPAAAAKPAFVVPGQKEARELAELVYNTWRISVMRANETAWRGSTSLSRQTKIRNSIVSMKGNFPSDYFRTQPEMPQLENFRFVGALANVNKDTLAATYLGRVQVENGQPADTAFVLQLVNERGKWKLDRTSFFNLSKLSKVRDRLAAQDLSVLQEQDGFQPYPAVPAAPVACKAPELIGKVFVDAPGRDIEMRINGVSEHEFSDVRRADVVSGGLRRGSNTITYKIKNESGKSHPAMAIGVFVMPETPGNHPVCVFDHILDANDAAEGGSFTFDITNAHIASMNPQFTGEAPQPVHAVPLKKKPAAAK